MNGGIESSVTAVTAAIIEHRQCQVEPRKDSVYLLKSDGEYRRLIKCPEDSTWIGFSPAVAYEENYPNPIYLLKMAHRAGAGYFQKSLLAEGLIEYYSFLSRRYRKLRSPY